ncbi:MAG: single-stranded DNA-binding protein, partial [Acidobacteria bacterium]|nr:single-stranded DNA-binding protein [Acidobacteriota bacterium]
KKYTTEIRAQRFQMLGKRDDAPASSERQEAPAVTEPDAGYNEDDIPF